MQEYVDVLSEQMLASAKELDQTRELVRELKEQIAQASSCSHARTLAALYEAEVEIERLTLDVM